MTFDWRLGVIIAVIATGLVGSVIYYVDYAAYMREWRRIQESRGHK